MSVRCRALLASLWLLLAWPVCGSGLASRLGFYQWDGVGPRSPGADLLTQAQRYAAETGARVFRLYLGARFDYWHPPGSPLTFADLPEHRGRSREELLSPARILALPRYRAALHNAAFETIILTTYSVADYGGGPDDLNLFRPWTALEDGIERRQIRELCDLLYDEIGQSAKTVVVANSEADEKMLEIMNYTGSPERAIQNIAAWTRARHEAIEQARAAHPQASLRLVHGFEISLVNLKIAAEAGLFRKSPRGAWSALYNVVPQVPFDLLLYSSYESVNAPFETHNADVNPMQIAVRLRRDLDAIRDHSRASLSVTGKRFFGERFVAVGELGFARERFEQLPTGGVLPRLMTAIETAARWGCPYIVIWQVFDARRSGGQPFGFGMIDAGGNAPPLRPAADRCNSVRTCVQRLLEPKRAGPLRRNFPAGQ
ncbi:MAG TPA: hypothetical protein VFA54_08845 [Bryobacterales bacterium]|jgi:hypothetical protein|nr:hypothetical protein [Bryobacterales bacterium]